MAQKKRRVPRQAPTETPVTVSTAECAEHESPRAASAASAASAVAFRSVELPASGCSQLLRHGTRPDAWLTRAERASGDQTNTWTSAALDHPNRCPLSETVREDDGLSRTDGSVSSAKAVTEDPGLPLDHPRDERPTSCSPRRTGPEVSAKAVGSVRHARRLQAQWPRREAEHRARLHAIAYAQHLTHSAHRCPAIAARLGLTPRTLRAWRQASASGELQARPRGRPLAACDVPTRNQVIRFLHRVTGPSIGVPALRALFPTVPRCLLEDLLRRYRRVWRRRYLQQGFRLTWHRPGTVWAMDFVQPPYPIDGVFPYLLAVRDLASHCQLAWRPVGGQTAADVLPVLRELFRDHGPPLVLKNDNGSAFVAQVTRAAMRQTPVAQLFSPPRQPQYNGSLERSNGVLQTYTHQQAVSEGHPFRWTCEDVEQARQLANTISRPWGHRGPSPGEAWQQRRPIGDHERAAFLSTWEEQRRRSADDLGIVLSDSLSTADDDRLNRLALSRTLQDLGYLTMRRVRRPPKKPTRLSREELPRRAETQQPSPSSPAPTAAENSTPPTPPVRQHGLVRGSKRKQLAPPSASDILPAAAKAAPTAAAPSEADTPAHRERTFTSWLRRPLTPLLVLLKAANISR